MHVYRRKTQKKTSVFFFRQKWRWDTLKGCWWAKKVTVVSQLEVNIYQLLDTFGPLVHPVHPFSKIRNYVAIFLTYSLAGPPGPLGQCSKKWPIQPIVEKFSGTPLGHVAHYRYNESENFYILFIKIKRVVSCVYKLKVIL